MINQAWRDGILSWQWYTVVAGEIWTHDLVTTIYTRFCACVENKLILIDSIVSAINYMPTINFNNLWHLNARTNNRN